MNNFQPRSNRKSLSSGAGRERGQVGQAFPLGLALLGFSLMTAIVLFNTGQLISTKMRVANTADAAVYSGLLWQARALNFNAYTNRAMVANQVSIGQAVSLSSWARYGRMSSVNVNRVLGGLPYVGAVTAAMESTVSAIAPLVESAVEPLLIAADTVNGGLSDAQQIVFETGFAATPGIIQQVAVKNDADFRVGSAFSIAGLTDNRDQWNRFTENYDSSDHAAMQKRAGMIRNSQDAFSNRREWDFLSFWFYTSPISRHQLHRRGETELIYVESESDDKHLSVGAQSGNWEWKSKDTLSLQNRIWRPFRGTKRVELPIGWSQSYANDLSNTGSIEPCQPAENSGLEDCPLWLGSNKSAERLAANGVASPFERTSVPSSQNFNQFFNGIRSFRDLSGDSNQAKDPRLSLRVEVHAPGGSVAHSDNALKFAGLFSADLQFAKNELASVAAGEVYFHRPEIDDSYHRIEYANTYNPFWDVRLRKLSKEERTAAVVSRAPQLVTASSSTLRAPGVTPSLTSSHTELLSASVSSPSPLQPYPESGIASDVSTSDSNVNLVQGSHFLMPESQPSLSSDRLAQLTGDEFSLTNSGLDAQGMYNLLQNSHATDLAAMLSERLQDRFEHVIPQLLASTGVAAPGLSGGGFTLAGLDVSATEQSLNEAATAMGRQSGLVTDEIERIRNKVGDSLVQTIEEIDNNLADAGQYLEDLESVLQDAGQVDISLFDIETGDLLPEFGLLQPVIAELDIDSDTVAAQALLLIENYLQEALESHTTDAQNRELLIAQAFIRIVRNESDLFDLDLPSAIRIVEMFDEQDGVEDILTLISPN